MDRANLPEWKNLSVLAAAATGRSIADLFTQEPDRAKELRITSAGLDVDFSKNQLATSELGGLISLARACELEQSRDAMLRGDHINNTEDRAVLHTALRGTSKDPAANALAAEARAKAMRFADDVRTGNLRSATGRPFKRFVNIGIGGSDLGPRLVVDALKSARRDDLPVHFVSNVDGAALERAISGADVEETLFVIVSKTFTTQETMTNARSAMAWVKKKLPKGSSAAMNFVAVSSAPDEVAKFGIDADRVFEFWDWVGGRFSLWSSVGLSIALAYGPDVFLELLEGAAEMDQHFADAPLEKNLPMILAMVGVWNRNFLGFAHHAILPYAQTLKHLPAFLQQLEMESNGKSVTRSGDRVGYDTAPAIWGASGTDGQHAFYQWLHQGPEVASADILLVLEGNSDQAGHQEVLLSHGIAQAEAFAFGRPEAETRQALIAAGLGLDEIDKNLKARSFDGSRPTTTIVTDALSPRRLGALLALYEHKVFCQGVVWDINSFDQWGVELGKSLAGRVLQALQSAGDPKGFDPSTRALILMARKKLRP